jgi:hypothetical protein
MIRSRNPHEGRSAIHHICSSMKPMYVLAMVVAVLVPEAPGATAPTSLAYSNTSQALTQIAAMTPMLPTVSTGASAPLTFSVSAGSLPPGMALNPNTGTIGGAPMVAGIFNPTIKAANGAGSATTAISLTVNADVAASPYSVSGWSNSQLFAMNPSATGIGSSQTNFPVLLRLTSINAAVFSDAGAPADVRFSKGTDSTVHYPYQVERWDATRRLAEIWVLVDTLFAASTSQNIVMFWGNAGAASASSGSAVFSPGNGFLAVWHLQDYSDATGNGYTLAATGTPVKSAGVVDSGYTFTGSSKQYLSVASLLGKPALMTLSCWVKITGNSATQELVSVASIADLRGGSTTTNQAFFTGVDGKWPGYSGGTSLYNAGWTQVAFVINPLCTSAQGPNNGYY